MSSPQMSEEVCPSCGGHQQVAVGATQFRCAQCNSDVAFAVCAYCQVTNSVLPSWPAFKCSNCGRETMLRVPGERLMRVGQALDSAGKTMNGIVGSIILIIIIVFFFKVCSP